MKKIAIVLAACLALAGCLPTINVASSVNLNTMEGIVAGYGILLEQERVLKRQPLCHTGTAPSVSNICVRRSTIVRLQGADRYANSAINQAVLFVKNNPRVDPSQYISAASSALSSLQTVVNAARAGS